MSYQVLIKLFPLGVFSIKYIFLVEWFENTFCESLNEKCVFNYFILGNIITYLKDSIDLIINVIFNTLFIYLYIYLNKENLRKW